jgi:phosphoribosylanthranilate isomerase
MGEYPYIGVTGIITPDEAKKLVFLFKIYQEKFTLNHRLMLGVLVGQKTLKFGQHPRKRYPALEDVPKILESVKDQCFAVIHYNTRNPHFSEELDQLFKFQEMYDRGLIQGVQLNISRPNPSEVSRLNSLYPDISIILQYNKSFRNRYEHTQVIKDFSVARYILIDLSGGRGIELDVSIAVNLYYEFCVYSKWGVGFAGGLNSENTLAKVSRLVALTRTTNFSIDAESGLRTDDALDFRKVKKYISGAAKAFNQAPEAFKNSYILKKF